MIKQSEHILFKKNPNLRTKKIQQNPPKKQTNKRDKNKTKQTFIKYE